MEIETARDEAFTKGKPYDIAGEQDIVQTRPQDQINLLALSAKAQRLIAAGKGDTIMTFRGQSNVNHELTAEEMDVLSLAALEHIEGIYQRSWARKDDIDTAMRERNRDKIDRISW
ncbi:hypothetical protein FHR95_003366 [Halomonas fontilapidosi]|uniref:DUF4376 domain-containing protein n=1 Tax=Halomonas fontilapidosi TaxID=616675 RepID=A0A7W5DP92_9GAMM|nr:hypothetical protein [Halomonas fontilapidosi]